MRIAIVMIGLILGGVMIWEINDVLTTNDMAAAFGDAEAIKDSDLLGVSILTAIFWIIGVAFAYGKPKIAQKAFASATIGAFIVATGTYFDDMWLWAIAAAALGFMCQKGEEERQEQEREAYQQREMLRRLSQQRGT